MDGTVAIRNFFLQLREKKLTFFLDFLLIPLIIFFSFYTPYFASGIFPLDEGQHLAAINEMLRGAIPYRDIYMMHGPLMEYIPYWLMKMFGASIAIHHGFYLFGNILSMVAAFFLLRTLTSNWILKYLALFFMLRFPMAMMWNPVWGGIRWAPGFAGLLLLYLWLRDKKVGYLFLGGVASGFALLVSQEIGLMLGIAFIVIILLEVFAKRKTGFKRLLTREAPWFLFGALMIVSPLYVYFAAQGIFFEYLRINFVDTLFLLTKRIPYSSHLLPVTNLFEPALRAQFLTSQSFAIYLIGAALFIILVLRLFRYLKQASHRAIFLFALGIYCTIGFKAAMRSLDGPQYRVFLPTFFITLAMFIDMWLEDPNNLAGKMQRRWKNAIIGPRVALTGLVLAAIFVFSGQFAFFSERISTLWSKAPSYQALDAIIMPRAKGVRLEIPRAQEINGVVGFLKEHTGENDLIMTFPNEGHINFLAERRSASRFGTALYAKVRDRYMEELINDLESKRPRYIVYCPAESIMGVPNAERVKPVWHYIQKKYKFLKNYGSMFILIRRS
jgi:hypothetical protein